MIIKPIIFYFVSKKYLLPCVRIKPMQIKVIIFSYERQEMLKALVEEVRQVPNVSYSIIDDGSSFVFPDNFHQFEHGGKPMFWRMWDYALRSLKDDNSDIFLFIPSDFSDVNFTEIINRHTYHDRIAYVYNVVNDGRENCWNLTKPVKIDNNTLRVGFTDCGFFCNKRALDKIGYYVNQVNPQRFVANKNISSGVGQQLTYRLRRYCVAIFSPIKSLAYHGEHPSTMHPDERIKNPLTSK